MSLNTTPATWVSGTVVTAAQLNTEIRDALTGIQAAWSAWTPTWTATTTNPTLGNGTLVGRWTRFGKYMTSAFVLTFGSTTTVGSGNYIFSIPATALAGLHGALGSQAELFDTSATAYNYYAVSPQTTTTIALRATGGGLATSAAPYPWAAGDIINAQWTQEAA